MSDNLLVNSLFDSIEHFRWLKTDGVNTEVYSFKEQYSFGRAAFNESIAEEMKTVYSECLLALGMQAVLKADEIAGEETLTLSVGEPNVTMHEALGYIALALDGDNSVVKHMDATDHDHYGTKMLVVEINGELALGEEGYTLTFGSKFMAAERSELTGQFLVTKVIA